MKKPESYVREDGVIVLPAAAETDRKRPQPKAPPRGTDPDSMVAVLYELSQENQRREAAGQHSLSYGQFVARRNQK